MHQCLTSLCVIDLLHLLVAQYLLFFFGLFCCFKVTEQSSICVLQCYQLSVFLKIKLLYFMLFDADKFEPEAIIFYLTVVT